MKNIFKTLAAFAVIALAVACSKDGAEAPAVGEKATVSFDVQLPGGLASRATNDGTTAQQLFYAVYSDIANDAAPLFTGETTINITATVSIDLVTDQVYDIVFWAQKEGKYTPDWNAKTIAMGYANGAAGADEERDAFLYVWHDLEVKGAVNEPVTLKRPFAQLNVGLTKDQITKAANAGFELESVKVTAQTHNSFSFAAAQGAPADELATIEFAASAFEAPVNADGKHEITVEGTAYDWVSFNYLLACTPSELTNVEIVFNGKNGKTIALPAFASVPVERNHRTNIVGDLLTDPANFNVTIDPVFDEEDYVVDEGLSKQVTTAEEMLAALAADVERIVVTMGADITLAGGTSQKFGTDKTKEIIINGNGYKLTYTDSYRTYINVANPEATLTLNDMTLSRVTTNTDTHWHNNNMKFSCHTKMNNVVFDKGITLDNAHATQSRSAEATGTKYELNNVTVTKNKVATYAIFILAGANVTIDGLTINHAEGVMGRGIKIVDEDAADKNALTSLSIANATFKTQEKAAVLVASAGGAVINWGEGNDISGVADDQLFAVWVDEDRPETFDQVIVNGAFCKLEGATIEPVAGYEGLFSNGESEFYLLNKASLAAWNKYIKDNMDRAYDRTYKLLANIDAEGYTWETRWNVPNSTEANGLVFDGNGKTIKNLTINGNAMFGGNTKNGNGVPFHAKDLTIDGATVNGDWFGGVILGDAYGPAQFTNVMIKNSKVTATNNVGAFVGGTCEAWGKNYTITFENCAVEACELTATGADGQDPTGASGYIGRAFAGTPLVFSGNNYVDDATVITNNNGLVGGRAYGYTTTDDNGWIGTGYSNEFANWGGIKEIVSASTYEEVASEAITAGSIVTLTEDVQGAAAQSSGYGKTGIKVTGGYLDGNGKTVNVSDANGTWDCAVNTNGGVIKNLTVNGAFRGIFMGGISADLTIENVVLDKVCYTFNSDGVGRSNYSVYIKNSTLNGWTSYSDIYKTVYFDNCNFGMGTGGYKYAFFRPYGPTVLTNCAFEAGFEVDGNCTSSIKFVNCTFGGEKLTDENIGELVYRGLENVTVE